MQCLRAAWWKTLTLKERSYRIVGTAICKDSGLLGGGAGGIHHISKNLGSETQHGVCGRGIDPPRPRVRSFEGERKSIPAVSRREEELRRRVVCLCKLMSSCSQSDPLCTICTVCVFVPGRSLCSLQHLEKYNVYGRCFGRAIFHIYRVYSLLPVPVFQTTYQYLFCAYMLVGVHHVSYPCLALPLAPRLPCVSQLSLVFYIDRRCTVISHTAVRYCLLQVHFVFFGKLCIDTVGGRYAFSLPGCNVVRRFFFSYLPAVGCIIPVHVL